VTDDELRQYAADLLLDHAQDVEFLTIHEAAEERLGHEISDEDARKVDTLMTKATVTVQIDGTTFESANDDGDDEDTAADDEPTEQRYALVSDDDDHHFVIHADRMDEWYGLDDDQINDGPEWAWQVGGAPNQVTFTNPLIFGEPLVTPSRE
jgi:hypothetical protein